MLRLPQVKSKTGLPTSTIYKLIEENQFPRQIKLGPRTVAWLETEVEEWIQSRIAERDRNTPKPLREGS